MDDIRRIVADRNDDIRDPEGLMFDKLRQFFAKKVFPNNARKHWKSISESDWLLG